MPISQIAQPNNFKRTLYDQRHGGPFDRGSADSYYNRPFDPHYYTGASYSSDRVEMSQMTVEQIVAYTAGYRYNEQFGDKKNWT